MRARREMVNQSNPLTCLIADGRVAPVTQLANLARPSLPERRRRLGAAFNLRPVSAPGVAVAMQEGGIMA